MSFGPQLTKHMRAPHPSYAPHASLRRSHRMGRMSQISCDQQDPSPRLSRASRPCPCQLARTPFWVAPENCCTRIHRIDTWMHYSLYLCRRGEMRDGSAGCSDHAALSTAMRLEAQATSAGISGAPVARCMAVTSGMSANSPRRKRVDDGMEAAEGRSSSPSSLHVASSTRRCTRQSAEAMSVCFISSVVTDMP